VLAAIVRLRRNEKKEGFPWCVLTYLLLIYK
jgi:hypothetical protein